MKDRLELNFAAFGELCGSNSRVGDNIIRYLSQNEGCRASRDAELHSRNVNPFTAFGLRSEGGSMRCQPAILAGH